MSSGRAGLTTVAENTDRRSHSHHGHASGRTKAGGTSVTRGTRVKYA